MKRLWAEAVGTCFRFTAVIGSGLLAQRPGPGALAAHRLERAMYPAG